MKNYYMKLDGDMISSWTFADVQPEGYVPMPDVLKPSRGNPSDFYRSLNSEGEENWLLRPFVDLSPIQNKPTPAEYNLGYLPDGTVVEVVDAPAREIISIVTDLMITIVDPGSYQFIIRPPAPWLESVASVECS